MKRTTFIADCRTFVASLAVSLFLCSPGVALSQGSGTGLMAPRGVLQEGWAYVYASEHQGRATASGETFQHEALTGAHRTLPLGSVVRVTNLATGRSVVVRINDRGPYIATRIVDLSSAAAHAIGMNAGGTRVRLELSNGTLPADAEVALRFDESGRDEAAESEERPATEYTIQLGSFSDEAAARRVARSVEGGWLYRIYVDGTAFYRVNFGIYSSAEQAQNALTSLEARDVSGFVKTVDDEERRTLIENQ